MRGLYAQGAGITVWDAPSDGRYDGRTAETHLLRAPDDVLWVLRDRPDSRLARRFRDLMAAFDARAMEGICQACGAKAKRGTALPERTELYFFCEDCAGRFG